MASTDPNTESAEGCGFGSDGIESQEKGGFKKTSSLCWLPLVLSLALLVRLATRVTLVEASRVSVCGLLLAHVR